MIILTQKDGNKPALIFNHGTVSFNELNQLVNTKAKQLSNSSDTILALEGQSTLEFIISLLAAFLIGKPVAVLPEHTSLPQGLCHPDTALILFTSGSSGEKKAVQLSQKNIMANCQAVISSLEFNSANTQALFLPLTYSFGLLGQLLPAFMCGVTTRILGSFSDIMSLVSNNEIPHMLSGVPSHWMALTRIFANKPEEASGISHVISAGARLDVNLRAQLMQTFPKAIIYTNYGLTEASPRVLSLSSRDPSFLQDTTGYPVGDWQLRISDKKELFIKGAQVMLGYLGDDNTRINEDGWLATGDLATVDANNLVTLDGRNDHVIKLGGEKVSLDLLERLIGNHPNAPAVAVVPVESPVIGTQLIICMEQPALTLPEIQAILKPVLPQSSWPMSIRVMTALPRNKYGKLDRQTLDAVVTR